MKGMTKSKGKSSSMAKEEGFVAKCMKGHEKDMGVGRTADDLPEDKQATAPVKKVKAPKASGGGMSGMGGM